MASALPEHADLRATLTDDLDAEWEQPPVDPAELARHRVTAVLVSHDGSRWLPDVLAGLAAATRPPDRLVAVDTGSTDGSDRLLAEALGERAVFRAPRDAGFGAAVRAGLASRTPLPLLEGEREWVWLLHDDCAPAPDALERLLELAVRRPDAAILGPKVREWRPTGRQLLELGLTVTGNGRRYTGLERREVDQGQHDEVRAVLAVGSAGMLVRRDVFDALGGLDETLGMFRDDLDLGWRANAAGYTVLTCPSAVVRHAEAAAHGRRRLATTRDRVHLVDRRNALFVLLANAAPGRFPLMLARTIVGCLLRAVGFLLGKQPAIAVEELAALAGVVGRPRRLTAARRARAATRTARGRELRRLFPGAGVQLRGAVDTLRGLLAGTATGQDLPTARRRASTFAAEEDDEVDDTLFAALTRPWVLLAGGLAVVALVAARGLIGSGRLMGGALLPAPDSARALWEAYVSSWHTTGLGSATPTPPYVAVLAGLGTLLGGNASLAVDLLLLGAAPLAGLSAWVASRGLVGSRLLRGWLALSWALLPATTGAVAAGRLGTAAVAVLLPLLARAGVRAVVDPGARRPADRLAPPLNRAFAAGLLLALVGAFTPVLLALAVVVAAGVAGGGAVAAVRLRRWSVLPRVALRAVVPLGTAAAVLLPWTRELLAEPRLLLVEAGLPGPGLSEPELPAWAVALGHPGGPGAAPTWLLAGVLAAALLGLRRPDRRGTVLTAWVLALLGLAAGLVLVHAPVTAPTLETPVVAWPGPAALVVAGGLLVAAAVGADRLPSRLGTRGWSWRQPVAVLAAVAAGLAPVAGTAWWLVRGAAEPLDRHNPRVLPAYVVDEAARPERPRTVVLRRADDGRVTYALLRGSGPRLGDAETSPPLADSAALDTVLGDLLSGRGGDAVARLSRFAVRYVFLPRPADPRLREVLDAVPGLTRASAPRGSAMWRVDGTTSRLRLVDAGTETPLPSGPVEARTDVPDGGPGRSLLLAEAFHDGWRAELDGRRLQPQVVDGWAQAFSLPADGGTLTLTHTGGGRRAWLLAQLAVLLVALLLALPGVRRDPATVGDVAVLDEPGDAEPHRAAAAVTAGVPFSLAALLGHGRLLRHRRRAGRLRRRRAGRFSAEDWLLAGGVPEERALAAVDPDDDQEPEGRR